MLIKVVFNYSIFNKKSNDSLRVEIVTPLRNTKEVNM